MANLILSLTAFACTVAVVAATAAQFNEMIEWKTGGTYTLANYTHYGCYCGNNTQGAPVDETDWCCHQHACCYNKVQMKHGCVPETTTYRYKTHNDDDDDDEIKCEKTHFECDEKVCDCDKEAAHCFRKHMETYNLHFHNMMNSASCLGPRPSC